MFRFGSETAVSFVDNRREMMEALDRDGAPVRPQDIRLLDNEIRRAQQYMEQAQRLQAASRRCGEGLLDYHDEGITRDTVCHLFIVIIIITVTALTVMSSLSQLSTKFVYIKYYLTPIQVRFWAHSVEQTLYIKHLCRKFYKLCIEI